MSKYSKSKETENLSKQEMREKAMDQMFGKNRNAYAGNIWGWKFSIFSLIGISAIAIFAAIGVLTGNIDLEKQRMETNPNKQLEETRLQQSNKDTLKSED